MGDANESGWKGKHGLLGVFTVGSDFKVARRARAINMKDMNESGS